MQKSPQVYLVTPFSRRKLPLRNPFPASQKDAENVKREFDLEEKHRAENGELRRGCS